MPKRGTPEEETIKRLAGKSDVELVARWHEIASVIEDELMSLNLERQYFDTALEVVKGNPRFLQHPGHVFMEYVRSWYGNSMAAGCRRQTDRNPNSASLRVLLEEIKARPTAYRYETISPYMLDYPQSHVEFFVMSTVVEKGTSGVNVLLVDSDLAKLRAVGKSVKDFVDKHVAHTDLEHRTAPVQTSMDQVYAAATAWEEIATRWVIAIKGVANLEVVDQVNWTGIFDFPWRMPNSGRQ